MHVLQNMLVSHSSRKLSAWHNIRNFSDDLHRQSAYSFKTRSSQRITWLVIVNQI